jgi:hypothetical protein
MSGSGFDTVSYLNYRDLRDRTTTLEGLYASETDPRPMSLAAIARPSASMGCRSVATISPCSAHGQRSVVCCNLTTIGQGHRPSSY